MAAYYAIKLYYLAIFFICCFGIGCLLDKDKDPTRVVGLCACLAIAASTAFAIWFVIFTLTID